MSKYREDDYAKVAARLATQMKVSAAASRLMRQLTDLYIGAAWISADVWEEDRERPGYRIGIEVHFSFNTALATERRRVLEIVKAATDREPFLMDTLDDGVRAVVRFDDDEGEATVTEMCARAAAGSLDRLH
jgi:hypothetical protein